MLTLIGFPQNRDRFIRLLDFFKKILDVCDDLNITPVLDGSLAVFAYTKNQKMSVNDVDLSCSETELHKIMKALDERGIDYRLREWHVIQTLGSAGIGFSARDFTYVKESHH